MAWIKNWFSNMAPFETPVVYQGLEFRTPEHLYQALKLRKEDVEGRAEVAALASPYEAKRRCRTRDLAEQGRLREDWEEVQLSVMELALRKKFAAGTRWLERLLQSTDDELVEKTNWHDVTWGVCICPRCKGAGRDELGKLLRKLRDEARVAAA